MPEPKIPQHKPYVVEVEPGTHYYCACGHSANQPFCDGSHQGTGFEPVAVVVEKKRRVAWCGCKLTKRPPQCDGAHKVLEESEPT